MKAFWQKYAAKLNALKTRERVLTGIAVSGVLGILIWALAIDPAAVTSKRVLSQIETHNATITTAEQQKTQLVAQLAQHPDAALETRIAEIDQQIAELDKTLGEKSRGLVAPDRMTGLVKGMLQSNANLRLVSLRTLAATPLVEPKETSPENAQDKAATVPVRIHGGVYKHGIELTVEGSYLDLMRYTEQLEAMPTQVMWQRTRVDATDFPRVRMTLTLFTLSLEKTWLTL